MSVSKSNKSRKSHEKTILNSVSGAARPGELLAILGPSGSGKTTLIKILNGWSKANNNSKITGEVRANGVPIESLKFSKLAGNVLAEDILLANLTVRESIQFSADIRTNFTSQQKKDLVDQLLEDLLLTRVQDSRVGSQKDRGISGGQKKRVSIGIELITNPSVLFLDEPTSGLDSFTALAIVKLLRNQADLGRTVLSTFHQPGSEIMEQVDNLMVMTDGYIVFHSPPSTIESWFDKLGYEFDAIGNPTDVLIYYISKEEPRFSTKHEKIQFLLEEYQTSSKPLPKCEPDDDLQKHNFDNIPVPFKYFTYISTFRYSFSAMVLNEFDGLTFDCEDDEVKPCRPESELNLTLPLWLNVFIL
eukprot:CAMPEP_0204915478 /NCGR_PEP_ID=MMETSP1397-20131031/13469_1 /ASSEMBLY_ACC=CAM_ASM_000891 /TAXON_ID=49980 /ORGANISM="Climacostomum Climacostomum virens, Strain Stock W-24" /LENGTH=359 /DNA_ID=CAMNT_0052087531 /DNA_START=96 /DNA_END=1172 /DNA_ORIENTATION=-